jgi:Permease family
MSEEPPKELSSSEDEEVAKEQAKMDEAAGGGDPSSTPVKTYKQRAKENGMNYTVTEVPPLGTSLLLGLQHYLTMLGATVLIPLIVCPAMGANGRQTAQVISSIFFVSGINTVSWGSLITITAG